MGKFFAASKEGESILALCSDPKNQFLISADTHGGIRVWNLTNYCCSTTSPVPYESNAPQLISSWQGHLSPITFCECTDYKGRGIFILTGSTDHTARLWSINGEEIGIFGQRQWWDIERLLAPKGDNDDQTVVEDKPEEKENEHNGCVFSVRISLPSGFLLLCRRRIDHHRHDMSFEITGNRHT